MDVGARLNNLAHDGQINRGKEKVGRIVEEPAAPEFHPLSPLNNHANVGLVNS